MAHLALLTLVRGSGGCAHQEGDQFILFRHPKTLMWKFLGWARAHSLGVPPSEENSRFLPIKYSVRRIGCGEIERKNINKSIGPM